MNDTMPIGVISNQLQSLMEENGRLRYSNRMLLDAIKPILDDLANEQDCGIADVRHLRLVYGKASKAIGR